MNKTFHSVWNASKQAYVAAAETVSARGKPSSGVKVAAVMASLMGSLLGTVANAQTAPPPLSSTALPTSGQLSAGQASISQSGAHMVINQSTQRAAINWQTFNVGKDAHVQFQQPSAASVTLNRVMSSDPSQIFGRITANGQVVLTNPAGVYFGKDARVDVGGLVATTHGMSDADFMAGKSRFERNGSNGSVVNEGELKAALGGYIALLAPEVRNQGAVIAQMGTVALAAGEAIDLKFDSNNRLTSLRVEPSQIAALVENKHAVQAPGGLVIISAQSMDRLVGGVVKNSGRIEANGLQQQGGRIVLSASTKVENTGSISANATADGPAGKVEISAPEVTNSGSIGATGNAAHSAGSVLVQATNFTQTATGSIDLSAPSQGGQLKIETTGNVSLQGSVNTQATQDRTPEGTTTQGGQLDIAAQGDIEVNSATLDASGGQGGSIALRAKAPSQPSNPNPLPDAPGQGRLAIMGQSTLSTRGRSSQGGSSTLLGDHIELLGTTAIDATGATGGGKVLVGGDWQGGNGVYQATTVTMAEGANIDASATDQGNGGKVVLWSTDVTDFAGQIASRGAGQGGIGGDAEVSGKALLNYTGFANLLGSEGGRAGELLLDPYNLYIVSGTGGSVLAGSVDSQLGVSTLATQLSSASVTISTGSSGWQVGNVGLMTALNSSSTNNLTINAAGNVVIAADVNIGGKLTINTGNYYDFVMGTNVSTASGVNITAHGGFEKTNTTGTSYLTGSITTTGNAITLNGDIQLANFSGGDIGLNSNGGTITLNSGTISRYNATSGEYALLTAYRLYHNPSVSTLGSDILLTYTSGAGVFLGQQGIGSTQYLLVGGGGGGGGTGTYFFSAGGGGGGQVVQGTLSASWGSSYDVVVGYGGAGSSDYRFAGGIGGTSRLGGLTALGGGGGASGDATKASTSGVATAGFTGGGGGGHLSYDAVQKGATGTGGANHKGGDGLSSGNIENDQRGGGGGGAGGAGQPGAISGNVNGPHAKGGVGITSSITGSTVAYGGGGGGGKRRNSIMWNIYAGAGTDGGGNGGANANGFDGLANRGGGGGGAASEGGVKKGGDGGSGIVVVRYTVGTTSSLAGNSLAINAGSGAVSMSSIASGLSSLAITVGSASTVSGKISGSTSFTKNGVGTLALTENNSYTGTNTITGGTLVLQNNAPNPTNKTFNGTGALRIEPSTSFTSAFSTSGWAFQSSLSGLTLGKDGNTQAITVASAISIAGPISIYGGNITLDGGLTVSGTNTITLKGSGTVTDGASGFVNAGNLLLLGGAVTLDSTSNAIGTLAASGIGSLTYVDSDALTIGTLGSTIGVSATGAVSIGTRTGDLTLSRNVSTTVTSNTSAVVLNAGITTNAGTSTGGNIIVSGTPSVTVGSGSRATLYSGSITGSTGLANLSGLTAGTGRFRYNADETTNFATAPWTNLGTGLYAVYREQPAASLSSTTLTMTYGDLLPSISATGLVNGDVSTYSITGRLNSTSGNIRASATPYTIKTDLIGLGYSAASGTGTLTVNKKTLTLVDSAAASRVYSGNSTATITSVGSLVGKVGSDVVTVSNTGATFDTKDVAPGKTVTLSGITLGSTDAANYAIASTATTTASITPKALTVTAVNESKTYDGAAFNGGNGVTYAGFAASENESVLTGTIAYGGNSQGAVDAGAYAITPSGLSSINYSIQFKDGVLTVNPKQLTVTGLVAEGKVYDGTANANITNWGGVSTGVTVGGVTEQLTLNHGTASFASKNVAYASGAVTGQTVTATGYSVSNGTASTGYSAGKASNYVLTSSSATTTATISPLALSISGVSINDKVYDGNATATVNGGNISKLGADDVNLVRTGAAGTFAGGADVAYDSATPANVTTKSVTVSGFTLSGADAGNYSVTQPTGLSATITRKTVTLNSLSTTSKTYDGTTSAPLSSTPTLSGVVPGESLGVTGTATYASADAGEGIQVNVTGLTLGDVAGAGGGKASNYLLSSTTATTTGTINRRMLTITGLAAEPKTYDGTTNVTIMGWGSLGAVTGNSESGLVAGETLELNHGTASFSTADVLRDGNGNPIAKTVTAIGYSLADSTGKASNYMLSNTSATTTATISPATLTVRANDDAKFVTKNDPSFTVSYSGFVNGETTSIFSAPNSAPVVVRSGAGTVELAGTYAGALTISGGAANNYTISPVAGSFTIVPAGQLLVRVSNVKNDYGTTTTYTVSEAKYLSLSDNTTIVDLTSSVVASGINNNSIALTDGSSGTANFDLGALNPVLSSSGKLKVGSYQVGASSISETSTNFNNTINVVGAHQVDPKLLTPSVTAGATKTYDGATNITGLQVSSSDILSGDKVTMTTGGGVFDSRNAGTRAYTVRNVALAGTTTPSVGDDSANYYVSNGTITGTGSISKAALTLTAVADTKVYDGTTASSKAVGVSGLAASDSISGLVQTFDSKNVTATTVAASGYKVNDGNDGNNYTVTSTTATGTITPAALTLSAVSDTKGYDGTTASNKTVLVSGLVAGDSITTLKQAFDTKNAGTGGTRLNVVTGASGYVISDGNSGNNYSVTLQAAAGTITPASLIVSGITASNKTYDGNVTVNGISYSDAANLKGLIGSDDVTLGTVTGSFVNKNAGVGKTVNLSYTLGGTDLGNYQETPQTTTTANIDKRTLNVSASGVTKVYDGTTGMGNGITLSSDKVGSDVINISAIGAFSSANVGTQLGYTLTVTGITGADAGNYSLAGGGTFTVEAGSANGGTITQRPLTVTANNALKTYDGQTWSGGNGLSYSGVAGNAASGFASGEDASVLTGTVTWGGTSQGARNAGSYSLSASGYNTSGNYSFTYVPGTLTINPAALTLTAVSETKVYDATNTSLGTVLVSGLQVGDSISNLTQAFDSKAVGTGESRLNVVSGVNGYVLNDGNSGANYNATLVAASGSINQRAIAIGGITASSKEYNGLDTATVDKTGATGWIVGDDFVVNATGTFSDKHVGTNKVVTLTSNYSGSDVGNYLITDQAITTADITAKPITISGITAANKVYDGDNIATVSVSGASGWIVGDSFSVQASGSFADRHVGTDKTVNLNVSYTGDDIGNYIVTVPASTTANITAKPVILYAPTASRDYNGQTGYTATDAQMAVLTSALGVAGDSISGITLTFDNKNVGENKLLTASNLVINDGNGGNNYAVELVHNSQSSITRLSSVSWTGLSTSNAWFDPLNWFGGAVPDLANVATVVIPEGFTADFNTTGSYPAGVVSNQPVSLLGLQGAGTLSMTAGDLNLGNNGAALAGFAQTGGSVTSTGSLSFTDSFSQTGGTLSTSGTTAHITISQMTGPVIESTVGTGADQATVFTKTAGPLSWANISSGGNLTVTASKIDFGLTTVDGNLLSTTTGTGSAGGVSQRGPVVVKGGAQFVADTGTGQDAVLLAINDFRGVLSFNKANGGSWRHASAKNTGSLTLGNVDTEGDFKVDTGGNVLQDKTSPNKIVVGGQTDLTAIGDITLDGPTNDFKGTVNADGKDVTLRDENSITLGNVNTDEDLKVTAGGDISQDKTSPNKIVVGGKTDLTAGGDITLDGPTNDFKGSVNADGKDVTLRDENSITLGNVNTDEDLKVTAGGDISQDKTSPNKIVVGGKTDLTAGGDITLDGPTNDFKGSVNADGKDVTLRDKNSITLGNVNTDEDLKVTAGGDISQDKIAPNKIVVAGQTDLTAIGDITLDGPTNDFKGSVNADGQNVTLSDVNDITLGGIQVQEDFETRSGRSMTQDSAGGKKILVEGKTRLTAGGSIVLDGKDNKFKKGVTVSAASYRIVGDSRKDVEEAQGKVLSTLARPAMPAGSPLSSTQPSQPLVMSTSTTGSSSGASSAPANANSAGVTVDLQNTSQQGTPLMVAVSLPKGASTVGTGFSFELPETVKSMATPNTALQITQTDGSPLPTWLKFDQGAMRFEATAVPDSALPMQLVALVAGQRVTVVISERTE